MNFESIDLINERTALLALSRQNSPLCWCCRCRRCRRHCSYCYCYNIGNKCVTYKSKAINNGNDDEKQEVNLMNALNINYNVELIVVVVYGLTASNATIRTEKIVSNCLQFFILCPVCLLFRYSFAICRLIALLRSSSK